jgi:hypothetical protein
MFSHRSALQNVHHPCAFQIVRMSELSELLVQNCHCSPLFTIVHHCKMFTIVHHCLLLFGASGSLLCCASGHPWDCARIAMPSLADRRANHIACVQLPKLPPRTELFAKAAIQALQNTWTPKPFLHLVPDKACTMRQRRVQSAPGALETCWKLPEPTRNLVEAPRTSAATIDGLPEPRWVQRTSMATSRTSIWQQIISDDSTYENLDMAQNDSESSDAMPPLDYGYMSLQRSLQHAQAMTMPCSTQNFMQRARKKRAKLQRAAKAADEAAKAADEAAKAADEAATAAVTMWLLEFFPEVCSDIMPPPSNHQPLKRRLRQMCLHLELHMLTSDCAIAMAPFRLRQMAGPNLARAVAIRHWTATRYIRGVLCHWHFNAQWHRYGLTRWKCPSIRPSWRKHVKHLQGTEHKYAMPKHLPSCRRNASTRGELAWVLFCVWRGPLFVAFTIWRGVRDGDSWSL